MSSPTQALPADRSASIKRASRFFLRGASTRLMAAPQAQVLLTKAAANKYSLQTQATNHVTAFFEAADILREVARGKQKA